MKLSLFIHSGIIGLLDLRENADSHKQQLNYRFTGDDRW